MRIERPVLSSEQLFWTMGALLSLLLMLSVAAPALMLWGDMTDDLAQVEKRLAAQQEMVRRAARLQGEAARLQPWTSRGPNPLPGKTGAEAREALATQIVRLAADAGLPPPGLTAPEETGSDRVIATRVILQAGPRPLRDFLAALAAEKPVLLVRELHLRPDTPDGALLNVEMVIAGVVAGGAP